MQFTSFSQLTRASVSLTLALSLTLNMACAEQPPPDNSADKPSNVSFSSITQLSITTPGEKILYGPADQNFMLHWPAIGAAHGTLIFIHGGCWSNQFDLAHASAFAAHVAKGGFDVWSLEYRRSGDAGGGWPGSLTDIEAAIEFIKDNQPMRPLMVAGHSAGGHLALLAGARQSDGIDAVVGLAAITQLSRYAQGNNSCQQMATEFMHGDPKQKAAAYALADPSLQTLHGETILLAGTLDRIVPIEQANLPGVNPRVVTGAGHFDWLHPQTEAFQLFTDVLTELTDDH